MEFPSQLEMSIFSSLRRGSKAERGSKSCELALAAKALQQSRWNLDLVAGSEHRSSEWGPLLLRRQQCSYPPGVQDPAAPNTDCCMTGLLEPHAVLHQAPSLIPFRTLTWDGDTCQQGHPLACAVRSQGGM